MGRCDLKLDLWPSFKNNNLRISVILFEVEIQ